MIKFFAIFAFAATCALTYMASGPNLSFADSSKDCDNPDCKAKDKEKFEDAPECGKPGSADYNECLKKHKDKYCKDPKHAEEDACKKHLAPDKTADQNEHRTRADNQVTKIKIEDDVTGPKAVPQHDDIGGPALTKPSGGAVLKLSTE